MRIDAIKSVNVPPVLCFEASELSDLVVIAGPNGVGKTRLISAMLKYFRNFSDQGTSFELLATCDEEASAWGKTKLNTMDASDADRLKQLLQKTQRRRNLASSVLYYESDRSIQNIKPLVFEWEFTDPWEESIGKNLSFNPLKSRWQDTIHSIFKKIQSQKSSIATKAIHLKNTGHESMKLEFSDPLNPFREAFGRLLGPKRLVGADVRKQTLIYADGDREDDVKSLSSGESEVLNIIFDFLLRKPKDCIVFFDEPELHLHPELLLKLITTLRTIGKNNQFFLITHSPAVISSSLDDSVIFLTPPRIDGANQAVLIKPDDSTSNALHKLGQSIGIVALGHKIALVERADSSLDKQTYGHILENEFPNIVLQPVGGKEQLNSFDAILDDILNRTIWGVEFFMLADRDAAPLGVSPKDIQQRSAGRFQVLSKYHLENYFLDESVLSACFTDQEPANSWLRDAEAINSKLTEIARSYLSYATALIVSKQLRQAVGNISVMPKGCSNISAEELATAIGALINSEQARVLDAMNRDQADTLVRHTYTHLEKSLESSDWKSVLPGKPVLASFASLANIPLGRLKSLYISRNAALGLNTFDEIRTIFRDWSEGG